MRALEFPSSHFCTPSRVRRRATRGGGSALSSVAPWLRVEKLFVDQQRHDRRVRAATLHHLSIPLR